MMIFIVLLLLLILLLLQLHFQIQFVWSSIFVLINPIQTFARTSIPCSGTLCVLRPLGERNLDNLRSIKNFYINIQIHIFCKYF